MAMKVTTSEQKMTPAKKNIKLEGILVKEQVIDALPEGTEQVSFKITVELPDEEDSE